MLRKDNLVAQCPLSVFVLTVYLFLSINIRLGFPLRRLQPPYRDCGFWGLGAVVAETEGAKAEAEAAEREAVQRSRTSSRYCCL